MSITRLSPLDASFLAVETPTAHMHVGWAAVLRSAGRAAAPSFDELQEHIAARLCRAPRCRQVLRAPRSGIDAPVWVDDENFEVARHVVRARSTTLAGRGRRVHVEAALRATARFGRSASRTDSMTGGSASWARRTTAWSTGSRRSSSPRCCSTDARSARARAGRLGARAAARRAPSWRRARSRPRPPAARVASMPARLGELTRSAGRRCRPGPASGAGAPGRGAARPRAAPSTRPSRRCASSASSPARSRTCWRSSVRSA